MVDFFISIYLLVINTITIMDILETIGRLTTLLEDAIEESDWDTVRKVAKEMDDLYNQIERQDDIYSNWE